MHTLKVQIVADASTRDILCISVGKGKQHDFKMLEESKVHFSPRIQVIADKGFQGLKKLHTNSVMPIKAKRGKQLSALEKIYNAVVSKCGIYIAHINRYIKRVRIFSSRYRNRRKKFALRFSLICGIYNFQHG